jgi:hypothetical protein
VTFNRATAAHTLTPAVLKLLEARLEILFWDVCETYRLLVNSFFQCKAMTFEPTSESREEPEVV